MITRANGNGNAWGGRSIAATSMALAMLGAACSISRPPATVSVEILGDQRGHPTGQRFYPPGEPLRIDLPAAANTNGVYLLTPADLRYLLTP